MNGAIQNIPITFVYKSNYEHQTFKPNIGVDQYTSHNFAR